MAVPVLIDTGPLVAIVNRRDQWHEWSKVEFAGATESFLSCEAVLSEAFYLLQSRSGDVTALVEMVKRDIVICGFSFQENRSEVATLLRKYADVPMSFADACLVRMAELYPGGRVFTTDEDFRIYRKSDRRVIPLIPPPRER